MSGNHNSREQAITWNSALHESLAAKYAGGVNRAVLPGRLSNTIRVDDLDGDVQEHFCSICVRMSEDTRGEFRLTLGNSPFTEELAEVVYDREATIEEKPERCRADIQITAATNDVAYLRNLARAYRRMTGKGASYPDRNWKWVCRRTANSLVRLADNIMEFRRQRCALAG